MRVTRQRLPSPPPASRGHGRPAAPRAWLRPRLWGLSAWLRDDAMRGRPGRGWRRRWLRFPLPHSCGPGLGAALAVNGPEPADLVDSHPQRPPAAAAVDVEEGVASHAAFSRGPLAAEASTKARYELDRGGGESSACHPWRAESAQARLCREKLSPQPLEVSLKGGHGSPKVVGDRGVGEPRDQPHTDQTLTLCEPSGPSECLRGAELTSRLGAALHMTHAGRGASTMPTSEGGVREDSSSPKRGSRCCRVVATRDG